MNNIANIVGGLKKAKETGEKLYETYKFNQEALALEKEQIEAEIWHGVTDPERLLQRLEVLPDILIRRIA